MSAKASNAALLRKLTAASRTATTVAERGRPSRIANGAPAEEGKNALGAGARDYRNLEEPVLDAVTAVAGIAGPKQHLTGRKPH